MPIHKIVPIPAFTDNYIWAIISDKNCAVVDPGEAEPVQAFCDSNGLTLTHILVTHHHWDHTNGIEKLVNANSGIRVYGPDYGNISHLTERLTEGDIVVIPELGLNLRVLEVPGHTLDHIAYVGETALFCGDTLFSGGCGRLFEGTPAQMNNSLGKLMQLPGDLPVYCTHEYTLANLAFAVAVEPDNQSLLDYQQWAMAQREQDKPTLPSTIGQEKAINPFLRTAEYSVKNAMEQRLGRELTDPDEIFAAVRGWKDNF